MGNIGYGYIFPRKACHKVMRASERRRFLLEICRAFRGETMSAYEELDKPSGLIEAEGRCPLCDTVMMESKSAQYKGKFYSFPFPLYLCLSHYHGYFRWLGRKGHVRAKFPEILKFGTVITTDDRESIIDKGLIDLKCPDCGFVWKELKTPHEKTWCPDCRREIRIPKEAFL